MPSNALTATPRPDRQASTRAVIDQQIELLTRLARIGLDIAEAAGRAAASPQITAQPDPALTYARAARAVRLTVALQSRLLADLAALDRDEVAQAAVRRRHIHRRVEQAIEAERDDEDEVERLSSAAWERLTDLDDIDIADLPLGEVVALICSDVGLSPAETAATSLPFMGRVAAKPPGGEAGPITSSRPGAFERARPPRPP